MKTNITLKQRLYSIVFESDTRAGRIFDIILLFIIVSSLVVVMLESMPSYGYKYQGTFFTLELIFTAIFLLEYIVRVRISPRPFRYIFSFWGVVDITSILPTLLYLLLPGSHFLLTIRAIRLLRIFRIAKLMRFVHEAQVLLLSIRSALYKISTFFLALLVTVIILGTIMYVVEGPKNGFTSIPQSIYWAIITITTVGYGDIVPGTTIGKFIASCIMIIGYAIIAVPTGIFTVEIAKAGRTKKCIACGKGNDALANYCSNCGIKLSSKQLE